MNENISVFQDNKKNKYTYGDLCNCLRSVGAHDCENLFVHSELSFGTPIKGLKRNEYLELLYQALKDLNVQTLIFPTYTFSFSNYEQYDICNSKSKMGVLTEFVRKSGEGKRSKDPLMSVYAVGKEENFVNDIGKDCLGEASAFDLLHKMGHTKILFFGADLDQCYTHMHYVEKMLEVPYRYDKKFTGNIIDAQGNTYEDTYTLFVKYKHVKPITPPDFQPTLYNKNRLKKCALGHGTISCMSEADAYLETQSWIKNNVNAFLKEPYDNMPLIKEYQYGNVVTVQ